MKLKAMRHIDHLHQWEVHEDGRVGKRGEFPEDAPKIVHSHRIRVLAGNDFEIDHRHIGNAAELIKELKGRRLAHDA